ncbi:hypothetical protein APSETT445_001754 [Aspergillus pseudonomiae]
MPSILEDPTTTLPAPQPAQQASQTLTPRPAHLKDGSPVTLYPVANGPQSIPADLVALLHREFSAEIEAGCTYPMEEPMTLERFAEYWFGTFAVVAVLGGEEEGGLREGRDWEREWFLTTVAARGRGVGIVMGETYLQFAPKLGYKYSVFNLVFENNVASVKIWERLGFKIIGRVPGAARLANSEELVDALIIGRDLV